MQASDARDPRTDKIPISSRISNSISTLHRTRTRAPAPRPQHATEQRPTLPGLAAYIPSRCPNKTTEEPKPKDDQKHPSKRCKLQEKTAQCLIPPTVATVALTGTMPALARVALVPAVPALRRRCARVAALPARLMALEQVLKISA